MEEKDIVSILLENGGKTGKSGADVKIQYNKKDITAIFRKSACEKLNVEKIQSTHFASVEELKKALEKLEKKYQEKTGKDVKLSYK